MRVIAGSLGGRNFASPHGHRTHPMSDKVRGAIFGVLGDIEGLRVLDAFAGSGALAIEAISRGAASAVAIEVEKKAHLTITENLVALGIADKVSAIRAFAGAWSTRHQIELFDIILLDPPYDHVPIRDLDKMPRHLAPDGTMVLSWPGNYEVFRFPGYKIVQQKNYGDAQLIFFQKEVA